MSKKDKLRVKRRKRKERMNGRPESGLLPGWEEDLPDSPLFNYLSYDAQFGEAKLLRYVRRSL